MQKFVRTPAALLLAAALAACGTGSDYQEPEWTPAPQEPVTDENAPITSDDIVDLDDLLTQEMEATAAAAQVGDPAQLLAIAQDEAEAARTHVTAVFDHLRYVTEGGPVETGTTPRGRPYGRWEAQNPAGTVDLKFTAVRTTDHRVRYFLEGKAVDTTEYTPLMTGIFVKHAPKKGGGRFHLSLTHLTDLGMGPNLDGSLHFMFANKDAIRHARRIAYVRVNERGSDELPRNFYADLLRKVGTGGRFRSVAIDDFLPALPGREVYALRVKWLRGVGGRGDAAMAALNAGDPIGLGRAHECWDADGLRVAYRDTFPGNDVDNPNEGTVEDCYDLLEEPIDESDADPNAESGDEEVDEALDEAGVGDLTEEECDAAPEM